MIYDMWLNDRAGTRIEDALEMIKRYGNSKEIYNSDEFPGWKRDIDKYRPLKERLKKEEIRTTSILDKDYPYALKFINDAPFLIYYKGSLPSGKERTMAIVGARKATEYGRWAAYKIGEKLSEYGITVVSGMAFGADTYAHKGCLDNKGKTIAVLGSGIDIAAAASNHSLADKIIMNGGALITEYPPGTPGLSYHYPKRNRIISGMCEGVIVVEAGLKSGTSITANIALDQGKDVYAIPGNITSNFSKGTNKLIKEGATPLIEIDDIIIEMGIDIKKEKNNIVLSNTEKEVYNTIKTAGEITLDQLCIKLNKTVPELNGILTILEIKGIVEKLRGKIIIAK